MVARPKMKPLDQANFYNKDQSWYMKQHFEYKERKLRFIIRRNAYDFQSSAIVQIQDPSNLAWLGLGSIPYTQMKSEACYAFKDLARGVSKPLTFLEDLRALQDIAKMLI
jgi:hypothetical protein